MKPVFCALMLICFTWCVTTDLGNKQIQSKIHCVGHECKRYRFVYQPMPYVNAEFFCRRLSYKGHLVSIHSNRENTFLLNWVKRIGRNVPYAWIGGIRFLETNYFIWTDGSKWTYTNWSPGQPDNTSHLGAEACTEMYITYGRAGKWNDDFCGYKRSFICEF